MKALNEPDHVSVPGSTRSPSDPSVVTAVADTAVETGRDGCDPCPLPAAAHLLSAPAADDPSEVSALDRNFSQIIDLSKPHRSLATSTRTRTLDSRLEVDDALSSFNFTHSVAP